MKSNLFIPKKLKVGFQERDSTYTKKLAYVIYYDEKNVLRKEKSFNSWINKKIDTIEYDNECLEGFVLNKKTGDYGGWNHRQAYTRIYDPRGFEIEITIENLLYILENCNCTKGKGIEGKFVYSWNGTELVLMPVDSPDYIELTKYNEKIHSGNFIKSNDLKPGVKYRHKNNSEYVYIGRFTEYKTHYHYNREIRQSSTTYSEKKSYYFYDHSITTFPSVSNKFIEELEPVDNFGEIFEKLEKDSRYSQIDKVIYKKYTLKELIKDIKKHNYLLVYDSTKNEYCIANYSNNINISCYSKNILNIDNLDTIEKIFEFIKPCYKETYLKNGKLHKSSRKN